MPSWLKRTCFASLFALVACSGGGGGCSSCGGIAPLTTPFPAVDRIENAASIRLTSSGFDFLSKNLGGLASSLAPGLLMNGVFSQTIPETSTKVAILTVNICDPQDTTGNPLACVVNADIGHSMLTVTSASPSSIHVSGTLLAEVQDVPIRAPTFLGDITAHVTLSQNMTCDASSVQFAQIPVTIDVPIQTDLDPTHGERTGLSRIGKIALNLDQNTLKNDLKVCGDDFGGDIVAALAGLFTSTIVGQLTGPLQQQIDNAVCVKGDANASPPCPSGSTPSDPNNPASQCNYSDGTCASIALGTEGNINLGNFLASISPTTKGAMDFQLALGGADKSPADAAGALTYGDLNPINMGATLSMVGGTIADPPSPCVKQAALTLPSGIGFPDEMLANTVKNWPAGGTPDFGLALNERFLNYAFGTAYNAGVLCIEISTDQVPALTAVSIVAQSLNTLEFNKQQQPLGIILRPSTPPTVKVGNGTDPSTDPNLLIDLKALSLDFYVWSSDRYIRAFTYTVDLSIPLVLDVGPMGLTPTISAIGVSNSSVTNSQLLKEDPAGIDATLDGVIGGIAGMFLGGIKPIDLSTLLKSLGLTLTIPPSVAGMGSPGLVKLSKNTDNYLAIFASLGLANGMAEEREISHTQVFPVSRDVNPEGVRFGGMKPGNEPSYQLVATSSLDDGRHEMEYGYRVDRGAWHLWSQGAQVDVRDPMLRLQGRHEVDVRSRVVGKPMTEDLAPAHTEILVDVESPEVTVEESGDHYVIDARDVVSPKDRLQVRFAYDGGALGEWQSLADLGAIPKGKSSSLNVEARDEQGNVGVTTQTLVAPEDLRGRVDTTGQAASSGCGCSVPRSSSNNSLPLTAFGLAGILTWMRIKRRRQQLREALAGVTAIGVAATWTGCNCGSSSDDTNSTTNPVPNGGSGGTGGAAGKASGGSAGKGGTPSGGHGGVASGGMPSGGMGGTPATGCEASMTCVELKPGLVGAYLSGDTAADGTLWVSGYNEADYDNKHNYGDLVVGKYDATKGAVAWATIDGTDPTEMVDPTTIGPDTWRGGKIKAGENVGLWTSLKVDKSGNPMVAYYDTTNRALKFAHYDGKAWAVHQVDQKTQSQIGQYAKLLIVNGNPVITYLSIEGQSDGSVTSKVKVARAKSATPAAATDWTTEEAVTTPNTPCRAQYCAMGKSCNTATLLCETPATTCNPACASGTTCFTDAMTGAAACQKVNDTTKLDSYPEAIGLYIAAAVVNNDVGFVYYDRMRGNLWQAVRSGGKWATTLLDGQTSGTPGTDTGDVGIGASLAVDAKGDWHISYVDGLIEAVKYLRLPGGTLSTTVSPVTLDTGTPSPTGTQFTDGPHIVGDDSNISVDAAGNITISYMDATSGMLRIASAKSGGSFTVKEYAQPMKFAGFFSLQTTADKKPVVLNWWRVGSKASGVNGDIAGVTPLGRSKPENERARRVNSPGSSRFVRAFGARDGSELDV